MDNYKEIIDELVREFADSIKDVNENKELVNAFEKYLYSMKEIAEKSVGNTGKNDKEKIEFILRYSTENTINLSLEQKKQKILIDENFQKICSISNKAFEIAKEAAVNPPIDINKDELISMVDTLNHLKENVRDFNKNEAIWLASEGILDLKFVNNPNTKLMSIRLGKVLSSK